MSHDAPQPLPEDLVPFLHARTRAETTVVAALMRSAGIPFYVDGRQLMDEFAISQSLLGLKSTISVHRSDLARAQQVLDEARAAGRELERRDEEPPAGRASAPGADAGC